MIKYTEKKVTEIQRIEHVHCDNCKKELIGVGGEVIQISFPWSHKLDEPSEGQWYVHLCSDQCGLEFFQNLANSPEAWRQETKD